MTLPPSNPGESPLDEMVRVSGRFHRSVHLPGDWRNARRPADYFATPALSDIAAQILGELEYREGCRAWTLTGPYGTGKSAFALFLADLLSSTVPPHPVARALRARHLGDAEPMQPLLLQAERSQLHLLVLDALASSARGDAEIVRRAKALRRRQATVGSQVAELLSIAAYRSTGGMILIVDELGKHLEHAASDPDGDIFFLQQIAEAAARSERPLAIIGILHSGFADYVALDADERRTEWQKVQGRFRDIPFALPSAQMLEIVSRALHRRWPEPVKHAYEQRLDGILSVLKPAVSVSRDDRERLSSCLPLHPIAARVALPLFGGKVAQHARSLFAFLTSYEPHGFQEFLRDNAASECATPMFGLPELYDYVFSALGMATLTGTDARKWGLIGHALDRVPAEASPLATRLVKAAGLLALYGHSAGLNTHRASLRAALDECTDAEFELAVGLLEAESILVFRRHLQGYGLWEGSDVDLDEAYEAARGLPERGQLDVRVLRAGEPRPLLARAHHIQTGTPRFFEPRLSMSDAKSVARALEHPTEADGVLLFLLDSRPDARAREARARVIAGSSSFDRPLLVASPRQAFQLGELLSELERWESVRTSLPVLEGDPVARNEVSARVDVARQRFERTAGRMLGLAGHALEPSLSDWFHRGGKFRRQPTRPRDLQRLFSKMFTEAYAKCPQLHNELLNRQQISTAAARARRELIARMLLNDHEDRLGIQGFPPEFSMHQSLLVKGGFHRKDEDGCLRLLPPHQGSPWLPVWNRMNSFVRYAKQQRRPVAELMELLSAPPFGIRAGPLPVLLMALIRVMGDELAVYEDGVFIPEIGVETLERLLRRPETFSMRSHQLTSTEQRAVKAVGAWARGFEPGTATDNLVPVVRGLIRMAYQLPEFACNTRQLPDRTLRVRELLFSATDPKALLLNDLPRALAISIEDTRNVTLFARTLQQCVQELVRAYPELLNEIEAQTGRAFRTEATGLALRQELRRRSIPLLDRAGDSKLRHFLQEAARIGGANGSDWREGLARAVAGGKPPSHWRDEDFDKYRTQIAAIGRECDLLSELAAASGDPGAGTITSIGVMEPGAAERRAVIACEGEGPAEVAALAEELRRAANESSLDPNSQLLAIALAARHLLPVVPPDPRPYSASRPASARRLVG